ncbi:MAG: Rne/Rng family ribonuclease [Geodermatophilaceae bacterium]|nr:Rne/Rng family ribonuclease [Geodermatophilaceae bacterium]
MAFMAPPDPDPVVPPEVADARETDFADGGRADGDSAPVKASRAGKAIASSADGTAETKPAKATRATTKATKAAQVTKAAGKTARTGRTAKQAPVAEAASVDGPSVDSTAVSLFEAIPSDEAVDAWESPVDGGSETDEVDGDGGNRRRRGRRGRGRGKTGEDSEGDGSDAPSMGVGSGEAEADSAGEPGFDEEDGEGGSSTRRRRRRRRRSEDEDSATGGSRVEAGGRGEGGRADTGGGNEEVRGISGSTRLEAKRQRRRDGRETGRRRAPILSEAEFLTRREAVNRAMVIRQSGERTQIAVLEDDIVVEHYITQASSNSFAGNVYLGKVQNVLPSMEAAFVDIGKGRNAVLYAGEVNWDAAGLEGKSRNIETAMKSGDSIVVQVTKDPMGHKGARLTSQVSLPGRYLVYVPNGSMTGISRKLPDVERSRLKAILKKIVPEDAGVIIRTAAEGASEEELTRDVNRLTAQWEVIQKKAGSSSTSSPSLLYQEPDLAIRVIRDVFNEDFTRMIVFGDEAWDTVEAYVAHVAPDLADRVSRHTGESDVFADLRVDEQLAKALDRKVWLPSGGSLVIDRTEAMTVVDVNTGKYTGSGGNLEQTVTRNNLEAAEEIVRQLRLRDIGGIIVIDFIDMVLESNRDLVLRRLTECLGRDRTRHQVAEVTSLGLVQMTRKRVGQGLLEVYSEPCEHCNGRGIIVHADPVDEKRRRSSGESSRGGDHHGDNRPHDGGDRNEHRGSDRGESRSDRGGGRSRGRNASRTEGGRTEPTADLREAQAMPTTEADRDEALGQSAPDSTPVPSIRKSAVPMSQAIIPTPDRSESADVEARTEQESSTAGPIVTASPRRRGRRGASRPAGPPVAGE